MMIPQVNTSKLWFPMDSKWGRILSTHSMKPCFVWLSFLGMSAPLFSPEASKHHTVRPQNAALTTPRPNRTAGSISASEFMAPQSQSGCPLPLGARAVTKTHLGHAKPISEKLIDKLVAAHLPGQGVANEAKGTSRKHPTCAIVGRSNVDNVVGGVELVQEKQDHTLGGQRHGHPH